MRLALVAGWTVLLLGCDTYYTKMFTVGEMTRDSTGQTASPPLDAKFGEMNGSILYVRFVSTWDFADRERMKREEFSVSVEQRQPGGQLDSITIDSLCLTLLPSRESMCLKKERSQRYSGDYVSQPRIRTVFQSANIPTGVDTVQVRLVAKVGASGPIAEKQQEFQFLVYRCERAIKHMAGP